MNPVIPLPLAAAKAPTFEHVGIVASWMLWPDSPEDRKRHTDACDAMFLLDRLIEGKRGLSWEATVHAVGLALHAPSPADIVAASEARRVQGFAIGMQFYNAGLRATRGEARPKTGPLDELKPVLMGRKASNTSAVNQISKMFEPVCCYWAAVVLLFDEPEEALAGFPCVPSRLPEFLKVAESFRGTFERVKLKNRKESLLQPGIHVMLPQEVSAALPAGKFSISSKPTVPRKL